MAGDEEMPREAFQRLRDSSFWSGRADVRRRFQRMGKKREYFDEFRNGEMAKRWEMLARAERWGETAGRFPYGTLKKVVDIIIG